MIEDNPDVVSYGACVSGYRGPEVAYRAIIAILVERLGGNVGISYEEAMPGKAKYLTIFDAPHLNGLTLVVNR